MLSQETLQHHLLLLNLGENLNEATPALVMMNGQVGPKLQPLMKKFTKCYWTTAVPMFMRDSRNYKHVQRTCLPHTEPRFRYALANSTLSTAILTLDKKYI
ncbi:hypothetical protein TNCV_1785471 [Trichonephila clavipes]|nr:hypothetical protein TNCV_1785471 [Trichonephila clavipes]